MITQDLLTVQNITIFLMIPGLLTSFRLAASIRSTLREAAKPMITFSKCQSLPAYQQSPNTLDIMLNGKLWGRVFPYREGYALTAKPNQSGEWQIKKHIMLDVAGTKELITKLATN